VTRLILEQLLLLNTENSLHLFQSYSFFFLLFFFWLQMSKFLFYERIFRAIFVYTLLSFEDLHFCLFLLLFFWPSSQFNPYKVSIILIDFMQFYDEWIMLKVCNVWYSDFA
jgi:hypothetical protein